MPGLPPLLVNRALKEEVKLASGPLQVYAGHSAGAEAAIHTMAQIFENDGTDGNLLVDASNIQITCPEMSMYMMMMINFFFSVRSSS